MIKYFLSCNHEGFRIMKVTHGEDEERLWDIIQNDEGDELAFDFLVDARDHCVEVIGYDPTPWHPEESWVEMREAKEAELRRQRHEDLPLFRKD